MLQNSISVMTIRNRVETSFEEEEFLEGAKDAWYAGIWYHYANISIVGHHKDHPHFVLGAISTS